MSKSTKAKTETRTTPARRCEGYRRYGGAFTLGPVKWEQCKETAVVMIKLRQDNKTSTMPGCITCWKEAVEHPNIEVLEAKPI